MNSINLGLEALKERQDAKTPREYKGDGYITAILRFLASWRLSVRIQHALFAAIFAIALSGCRKEDMAEQPRYDPHRPSAFFADGNSARPLVEGTVSRTSGPSDAYEYLRNALSTTAPAANNVVTASADFPADFPRSGEPLRRQLERGQERYNIYCSVCHGQTGAGDGMIVQRGFIRPPSFYPLDADMQDSPDLYHRSQNLVTVPPGYVYDKITNGYGAMYSYAARVAPADRWAIAAYIRVLQLSQAAPKSEMTAIDQGSMKPAASGGVTP